MMPPVERVPRLIGVVLWLVAAVASVAVGAEIWLTLSGRAAPTGRRAPDDSYQPFVVQYLHPQYLFFFPFQPDARVALSNEVVHLTPEGFRGSGPAEAGTRQLAFLIGGSAAFGQGATSDDATIPGHLNRIQTTYFFVNAGVPSWVSTQEMFRVAFELLDHRPALIVAYDGANDADVLINHKEEGGGLLTVGSAESFLQLQARVEDISGPAGSYRWFPELRRRLGYAAAPQTAPHMATIDDEVMRAAVARYLNNHERMRDMTRAVGARFVTVLQPLSGLHRNTPRGFESWAWQNDTFARFYTAVSQRRAGSSDFLDLSSFFDTRFESIPVGDESASGDPPIFTDGVHLTDLGNRLVAERLSELLVSEGPGDGSGQGGHATP